MFLNCRLDVCGAFEEFHCLGSVFDPTPNITSLWIFQIFFIEFNKQLSQEDHVDLLDWFAELASGKKKPEGEAASEDPAKDEESAKEAAKEK